MAESSPRRGEPTPEPSELCVHLGRELRRRRTDAGMSQDALAARIKYSQPYVSQAELARELPAGEFFRACDDALRTGGALLEIFRRVDNERRSGHRRPALVSDEFWTPGAARRPD